MGEKGKGKECLISERARRVELCKGLAKECCKAEGRKTRGEQWRASLNGEAVPSGAAEGLAMGSKPLERQEKLFTGEQGMH